MSLDSLKRDIKKKWKASYRTHSQSHKAGMLLPPGNWEEFDPFLLLAEDWFQRGTFPLHPHRGIETVTYVIEGSLEHYDNNAGDGVLSPGDVQWMTAGKGVIHSEEPAVGETVHSLQLWVNLPSKNKLTEPRYQNLRREEINFHKEDGKTVHIFSGESNGIKANTLNYTPVLMLDIELDKGKDINQPLPGNYNGFIYVLEGEGEFGFNREIGEKGDILWLSNPEVDTESELSMVAKEPLRCLLYAGLPINEPVVAKGPFVMNTEEEIRQAYTDYMSGKFTS